MNLLRFKLDSHPLGLCQSYSPSLISFLIKASRSGDLLVGSQKIKYALKKDALSLKLAASQNPRRIQRVFFLSSDASKNRSVFLQHLIYEFLSSDQVAIFRLRDCTGQQLAEDVFHLKGGDVRLLLLRGSHAFCELDRLGFFSKASGGLKKPFVGNQS